VLSPTHMRKKLEKLINREMELAQKGRPARIDIKLNNLADQGMINKIVEAAKAGVKIRMLIRGTCSLSSVSEEVKGNIEIVSIIDKYLEHSRMLVFHNDGDEQIYLTSADWMIRNLNSRVEMSCPVFDPQIRRELKDYLEIQFRDNMKSRLIDEDQQNHYKIDDQPPCRSQEEIYLYLKENAESAKQASPTNGGTAEPERSAVTGN
jgi:polyphosphate kinase